MRKTLFLILGLLLSTSSFAQRTANDTLRVRAVVFNGDTIPYACFRPISIYEKRLFKNVADLIRYEKLVRDVTKVWPYARLAGEKYTALQRELLNVSNKRTRKELIKRTENEIKESFEKDLKNLTISQGTILIKLLDRQTGETGYVLVQDLKSSFSAFLWQGLARLFGHNLKSEYNALEENEIEAIVQRLEAQDRANAYNQRKTP